MVSVLALYSDDPSSNPAKTYAFSLKFVFEKNENKKKEAGVGPLKYVFKSSNHHYTMSGQT